MNAGIQNDDLLDTLAAELGPQYSIHQDGCAAFFLSLAPRPGECLYVASFHGFFDEDDKTVLGMDVFWSRDVLRGPPRLEDLRVV